MTVGNDIARLYLYMLKYNGRITRIQKRGDIYEIDLVADPIKGPSWISSNPKWRKGILLGPRKEPDKSIHDY